MLKKNFKYCLYYKTYVNYISIMSEMIKMQYQVTKNE